MEAGTLQRAVQEKGGEIKIKKKQTKALEGKREGGHKCLRMFNEIISRKLHLSP